MYYATHKGHSRSHAGPLIFKETQALIKDMLVQVEFKFHKLNDPGRQAEIRTILKMPQTNPERPKAIKQWVDDVVTPKAASMAPDAQTNTAAPITDLDPFGIMAALTATLGFAPPNPIASEPLYHDPIEALHLDPLDPR